MIPYLSNNLSEELFPSIEQANPEGLVAVSQSMTVVRTLAAYQQGIFPWHEQHGLTYWFSPDPRLVFFPEQWSSNQTIKRAVKNLGEYQIKVNASFESVIHHCATRAPSQNHLIQDNVSWISKKFIEIYTDLHIKGWAHSIEVWQDSLVGGIYGIGIGNMFFGESMVSLKSGGSKVAFQALMHLAQRYNWSCVDGQVESPHLMLLGGVSIPRKQFKELINNNPTSFLTWR